MSQIGKVYTLWQKSAKNNDILLELRWIVNYFEKNKKIVKSVVMRPEDYNKLLNITRTSRLTARGYKFLAVGSKNVSFGTLLVETENVY